MPSPEHEAYRKGVLFWFRAHAEEPDVAAQLARHEDAAAILWELDLAAARPVLAACYAPSPRGSKPLLGCRNRGIAFVARLRDITLHEEGLVVALERGNLYVVASCPRTDDHAAGGQHIAVAGVDASDLRLKVADLRFKARGLIRQKLDSIGRLLGIAARVELQNAIHQRLRYSLCLRGLRIIEGELKSDAPLI